MTVGGWLLDHFEKLGLGAAAAWLAVTAVGFAATPPEVRESERLAAEGDGVCAALEVERRRPVPVRDPAWDATLHARLDADRVPSADALPAWGMHRRPQVVARRAPLIVCPLTFEHQAPAWTHLDASARGRVALAWDAGRVEAGVAREALEVWRQSAVGDDAWGEWRHLVDLPGDARQALDDDVLPWTRYRYRLVARARLDADDPRVRQFEITALPPGAARVEGAVSEPLETPREVLLQLNSVTVADPLDPKAVGGAYVFVERFDRASQRFVRRGFPARVGQAIGSGSFLSGAVLLEVGVTEHAKAQVGRSRRIQWARVRWPSGAEEALDDARRPD